MEAQIVEFLDYLRSERGASAHTIAAYRRDLALAAMFFRENGIEDWGLVEAGSIRAYAASLGPPMAPSTAQRRMSALRTCLKYLRRTKQASTELPSLPGYRKRQLLPRALERADLERLLAANDLSTAGGIRDRTLFELIYGAGLRVSEAISVSFAELDLIEGALRVTGKRGKSRWVPLPETTVGWVRRYLETARPGLVGKKPSDALILSDRGQKMARQTVDAKIARLARMAGLERRVSPHVLRHSYAVHLLQGGADLRALQELLGHESIATTQAYTHLDMTHVRSVFDKAHPRR